MVNTRLPKTRRWKLGAALALLFLGSAPAAAEHPVATPDDLGGPVFTPLGAERSGNATGSIPAWDGGIITPPDTYEPGRHETDPFPDDTVIYTVTADNLDQHSGHLSEGQKALLQAYPDSWRMNVYRTRRTASYPDWVYEAVRENARLAELSTEGKGGVRNARVSSPFPIPETGVEVIWNHNLRWRGIRVKRTNGKAAVTRKGRYSVVLAELDIGFPYGVREPTPFTRKYPNLMIGYRSRTIEPSFLAGDGGLIIEPIDQTESARKSWLYNRALKRVVRTPTFGYGMPGADTDGLRTVDEFELFNGSPYMYEWRLLGKRELLIPYNSYRIHSSDLKYDDVLHRDHVNPELVRFELHRVWVVEGRLKDGMRHVYSRRVFYVDEDSWQISVSDSYDLEGGLWRTAMAHGLNYYTVPVHLSTLEVFHDLEEQRYYVDGLDNRRAPYEFLEGADPREFSPNALPYYVR
jgi:hypothetical protein